MDPAYLAGFFDGEGSIGLSLRPANPTHDNGQVIIGPSLSATQSEPHHQVLLDIRRIYGGGLYPKINYADRHSQRWDWRLARADNISRFLTDILPHLRIKRDRALLLLETMSLRSTISDRSSLSDAYRAAAARMAAMNLRGPPPNFDEKKGGLAPPSIRIPDA